MIDIKMIKEHWDRFSVIGDLSMTFGKVELWHYFNSANCKDEIVTALCGGSFNDSEENGCGSMWVDPYDYVDLYNTPANVAIQCNICPDCVAGFVKATDSVMAAIEKGGN